MLVDEDDLPRVLSAGPWQIRGATKVWSLYVARGVYRGVGKQVTELLHRFLLNPPRDMFVDHINGNGLDNRRTNLRLATREQNARNAKRPRTSSSGLKGACWDRRDQRWRSTIRLDGRKVSLGYFRTAEEAHRAYCEASAKHYGEFARHG